jgi:8-oxo-dGTP diphosphatase
MQVSDTPMHSVAMVGVVPVGDRVLCIKRQDNGRWEPPAGVLERDETFQACVEREVLEETGVTVRARRVTGLYKNMVHPKRPVTMVWLCDYLTGTPRATEESREARWLTVDEVKELLPPAHAARILDAISANSSSAVAVRYHNGTTIYEKSSVG